MTDELKTGVTSMTAIPVVTACYGAQQALDSAVRHLIHLQSADGWWQGDMEMDVTNEVADLLTREFLNTRDEQATVETARWIRSRQRADGTWATFYGGPPDLSTTAEAWVGLRLAGDSPDAPHMRLAAEFVRRAGGIEQAGIPTRIWLALFGLWPWEHLPCLAPELILLPRWLPLNVYDWASWGRLSIVPLTILSGHRPVHRVPFGIDELRTFAPPSVRQPAWTWAGAFQRLDAVLHRYSRRPVRRLRERAVRRGVEWLLAHQEADGLWGGLQQASNYSLLALHVSGHRHARAAITAATAGIDSLVVRRETPEGWQRRVLVSASPVWDTSLALTALLDAGVEADHAAVLAAADWLLDQQVRVPGDWAIRRPSLTAGGWPFQFHNNAYPDIDDTAEVLLALQRVRYPDTDRVRRAFERGVNWTVGLQSRDGGWSSFDPDVRTLVAKVPYWNSGFSIDVPTADVTAHVVECLGSMGLADSAACRRGVRWLRRAQERDGSWFGRWGVNYLYGTGAAVPALTAAGVPATDPAIRNAVAWLIAHQNPDGGWGEDARSYEEPEWIGRGPSTASQTAWALLALLAADERQSAVVRRGIAYLTSVQSVDGSWDEPSFSGTLVPGVLYAHYDMYRLVWPIAALGRYLQADVAAARRASVPPSHHVPVRTPNRSSSVPNGQ